MLELNNIVIAEFVAAVSFCIEEQRGRRIKDGKYFAVNRTQIEELLDRNQYAKSAAKFALWKRLHWIDSDERQITKSVYIKEESKSRRMIVVDLSMHEEFAKFCSNNDLLSSETDGEH